jgi:hypothetical protein
MITHSFYDTVTGETLEFFKGEFKTKCAELGIPYTALSHLKSGRQLFVAERYVLSSNKHLIFTLVDFDTNQEYECISNKTIFLHLNAPYCENESKFIYELKTQRQNLATIAGRVFYVKEFGRPKVIKAALKGDPSLEVVNCLLRNKTEQKIRSNIRTRFYHFFKKSRTNVKYKTRGRGFFNLLGCSRSEFIKHIESQFYGEISWENYGEFWHIDHVYPCCTFDLMDLEQVRQCWHYTNLRPLTKKENLSRPRDRSDI